MSLEQTAIDQADFDEMSMIAEQHEKKVDDVTCSDVRELEEARARIVELELECNEFIVTLNAVIGALHHEQPHKAIEFAENELSRTSINQDNQEKTKCNYPECKCPFDMGSDNECLLGLDN